MTDRDRNTLDLTYQKLRIAPDVLVWPVREQGELVYRLEIPKLHRFFRVGYEEYVFLSLLDGATTIPQACGLAASKLGSAAPTAEQAKAIGRWLLTHQLAHLDSDDPPARNRASHPVRDRAHPMQRLFAKINPFWIKVPIPLSDRWTNRFADRWGVLFSTTATAIGVLVVALAFVLLVTDWREFSASAPNLFHPGNWIGLLVTWVFLKLIHELAHAVACRRHGGSVAETGIVFVLFAPLAYVDVSSCWRMGSRWSRIAVASAGMYVELVVAALAILAWQFAEPLYLRFLLHNLVIAAGLSTLLFNANVLMRFDGYFVLADLVEIPNLYSEGSNAVGQVARRLLTGDAAMSSTLQGWRKWFVLAYGVAALLWRITICVSLGIAASTMFAGAGILLTLTGVAAWIGAPSAKILERALHLKNRSPQRFVRAAVISGLVATSTTFLVIWCPVPTSISALAINQYTPETILRSRTSGFIASIEIDDGATVQPGELLIQLEDPQLLVDLKRLQIEHAQNEVRLRRATGSHDPAMLQILRENQRAVAQRIDQLETRAEALQVIAPRAGTVVARDLASKLGNHVNEGDVLLIVAGDTDKELVAMIGHAEIDQARMFVGHQVPIRTAGFQVGMGRLDRIEPRASDQLSAPALAATEGGSLPVRAVEDGEEPSQLRLLQPHFRGRIVLDPATAANLPVGARSEVWVGYRTDSLYDRLQHRIGELWREARDQSQHEL